LTSNAAAVIFTHNYPSDVAEPSDTDVRLTRKLTDALALIDVRVSSFGANVIIQTRKCGIYANGSSLFT